jgi:hypothetical protein
MRLISLAAATIALTALTACGYDPAAPLVPIDEPPVVVVEVPTPSRDESALFQTDSLRYALVDQDGGAAATIGVRFTNVTGSTAYFVNCNGMPVYYLEKLVDDTWSIVWSPVFLACLSDPIVVARGNTHDLVLRVYANNPGYPTFNGSAVPGVYRLVWSNVLSSYTERSDASLPLEKRVSNRFALTTRKGT